MRRNNTALIVIIAGIFLFLLLAVGSLAYAVFVNGSKTTAVETAYSEKTDDEEDKETGDTARTEKKTEKPKESKVTLAELKEKKAKNNEYSDNLAIRMKPIHRSYTGGDLDYENTDQINEWGGAWDDELNAVYQALMKKLTPSQQEELRTEQRKWIKQRDAKLNESGYHLVNADLFYNLTMDRTYELAELYDKVK